MTDVMIVPQPALVNRKAGHFTLTSDTVLVADAAARAAATLCHAAFAPATGFPLAEVGTVGDAPAIVFCLDPALAKLGAEGYRLTVTPRQVNLRAPQSAGLVYALQSLRQLAPPEIFQSAPVAGGVWEIPCVEIEDYPRFGWRGAMLDVGRHFMPKDFVLKFIDLLTFHKLNVFHWHLTDDQGWRIEIKQYPRLTEVGAWRAETVVGHPRYSAIPQFDGTPHGGFYTQDEVREVVAYAAARGVTIVPEIEMPGHAQAAIAAYPELGNTGETLPVYPTWGVNENVYNVEENTLHFLQNVLDEMLALFPGPFIHVGGDEVPKKQWETSPAAQARMRELGLRDEAELQSYFIRRMDAYLTERGRRLVGWDEILEGGLAANATVMSWRGVQGGISAAAAGHDVVMAPNSHTYLDYYQSEDREREPLAIGGYVPLEKVYHYEPVSAEIDAAKAHHVLGAQAQLWTEYMKTPAHVEYMAYPRLCALAEVTWTPPARKDYVDFVTRLQMHLRRLAALGVNYRPVDVA